MPDQEIKNIIFDLDGTLVDSAPDIFDSIKKALISCGVDEKTINMDDVVIGPPILDIMKKMMACSTEKAEKAVLKFRSVYDQSNFEKTTLYPGVREVLQLLKNNNFNLFVATNKPEFSSKKILRLKNIEYFFTDTVHIDSITGKKLSKTAMIKHIIDLNKLKPDQTIMVGDTASDINSAHSVGIQSVALLYGYGDKSEILKCNPVFTFSKINDILHCLNI